MAKLKRVSEFAIKLHLLCTFLAFDAFAQNGVGVNTTSPLSSFEDNGSFGKKVSTITANTTLDDTYSTIVCNNGSTAIAVTLPTASTCTGRIYEIKRNNTSTANVTITATIDGATNLVLTQANQSATVFSDGTAWRSRDGGVGPGWSLTGNSGTTAGTNFLGTTDGQDLVFKTNSTEEARLTNGNGSAAYFGVGTSSPSTYGRICLLSDGEGKNREDDFGIASFNSSPSPTLLFWAASGTTSSPSNISSGDDVVSIFGKGRVGGSFVNTTIIRSNYLGDGTTNLSDLEFYVSNAGSPQVYINSSGYVGIGNTSPGINLDVVGSTSGANVVNIKNSSTTGYSSIDFSTSSNAKLLTIGIGNPSATSFSNKGYINAYDNDFVLTHNSTSNDFYLKGSNGYIGLGTTSPSASLDINGSVAAAVTTTSANITLDATHYIVIILGTSTITLPTASTCARRIYHITNTTSASRTISSYNDLTNTAQTTITANTAISIVSDGTTWRRFR